MNETITNLVADAMAEHCMHCPALLNNACVCLCHKVDSMFPTTLREEYATEWIRQKDALRKIYATPLAEQK